MAFYNKFIFIGDIGIAKDKEKFYNSFLNDKGTWRSSKINFMIKESDHNAVFVELFGGYMADGKGKVFSKDLENNNIEIPWADRNNTETLKMVADMKKFKVNFGEQKEFITEFDMIECLKDELPKITKPVVITGQIKHKEYKGKYTDVFIIKTIRLAKEDEKNKLSANIEIYYSKDSLDTDDFKEEKIIKLAGFVPQYIDKETGIKYMPHPFILSAKKLDFTNEKHVEKFEFLKKYLTVKTKTYVHIPWQMTVFRGADEVDWNESMLTKAQKEQVAFGLSSVDDFKPKSNMLGGNIYEYRLTKPLLVGDFSEGVVDSEIKIEEFENNNVFTPVEKTEKFKKPKEEKLIEQKVESKVDEVISKDDEDLFS